MSFLPLFWQKVSLIGIALSVLILLLKHVPGMFLSYDDRHVFNLISGLINDLLTAAVGVLFLITFAVATFFKYMPLWVEPGQTTLLERVDAMPNPKRWNKWGTITSAFVAIFVFYHVIQGSSLLENWLESQ